MTTLCRRTGPHSGAALRTCQERGCLSPEAIPIIVPFPLATSRSDGSSLLLVRFGDLQRVVWRHERSVQEIRQVGLTDRLTNSAEDASSGSLSSRILDEKQRVNGTSRDQTLGSHAPDESRETQRDATGFNLRRGKSGEGTSDRGEDMGHDLPREQTHPHQSFRGRVHRRQREIRSEDLPQHLGFEEDVGLGFSDIVVGLLAALQWVQEFVVAVEHLFGETGSDLGDGLVGLGLWVVAGEEECTVDRRSLASSVVSTDDDQVEGVADASEVVLLELAA